MSSSKERDSNDGRIILPGVLVRAQISRMTQYISRAWSRTRLYKTSKSHVSRPSKVHVVSSKVDSFQSRAGGQESL